LFSLATWKYPAPDTSSQISYSGWAVWYQWVVWTKVTTNLKSLNEIPLDPLMNTPYIYSTTQSYKEYEVLALYEWNVAYNPVINSANAATTSLTPKVVWNYNWVFVIIPWYIIPTPSIITSEPLVPWIWIPLTTSSITSQVITSWTNMPQNSLTATSTWALNGLKLSVFTWSIAKGDSDSKKVAAMIQIQRAYSGSTTLSTNQNIAYILNQTSTGQILALTDITLLKWQTNLTWNSSSNTAPTPPPIPDWTTIDPHCTIPNITIWSQVWAWCNSTLWNWFEYSVDQNCYNYQWWTTTWCNRSSNEKENIYNPTYWINNIWWKLYTWADSPSACTTWYHVPSDAEFETLETTLNWWTNCRNATNWWLCTWLWWASHTTKTPSNNIVQALKIPLSGDRSIDGVTFHYRGDSTGLWSSSPISTSAYGRVLYWGLQAVRRTSWGKAYGFSVRCLKD